MVTWSSGDHPCQLIGFIQREGKRLHVGARGPPINVRLLSPQDLGHGGLSPWMLAVYKDGGSQGPGKDIRGSES